MLRSAKRSMLQHGRVYPGVQAGTEEQSTADNYGEKGGRLGDAERGVHGYATVSVERGFAMRTIVKVGLAVVRGSEVLLVRKRGTRTMILPGGKPADGEDDLSALQREIQEELGCFIGPNITFIGEFSDIAADLEETRVIVKLYLGKIIGEPKPAAEIEEVYWHEINGDSVQELAPSLSNSIIPFLCSRSAKRDKRLRTF